MTEDRRSAIVVLVPGAEPLVGPWRERYDPSARWGMPAHVTVLYPFIEPAALNDAIVGALCNLFASVPAFELTLAEVREFPGVTWLAPASDEPFRRMIRALSDAYPEYKPYGGAIPDPTPHLTVADVSAQHERVKGEFVAAAAGSLPIRASIREVALMIQGEPEGRWEMFAPIPLGTRG